MFVSQTIHSHLELDPHKVFYGKLVLTTNHLIVCDKLQRESENWSQLVAEIMEEKKTNVYNNP